MANSQMLTSKKPRKGARTFHPRAIKIVRIVASVTTVVSAKKTRAGKLKTLGTMELSSRVTGLLRMVNATTVQAKTVTFGHNEEAPIVASLSAFKSDRFGNCPAFAVFPNLL